MSLKDDYDNYESKCHLHVVEQGCQHDLSWPKISKLFLFPTLSNSNRLAFSLQGTAAAVSSFFTGVGSDVGENRQCGAQPSSSAVVP